MPNQLLGVFEVARLLRVSPLTVTKWKQRGIFIAPTASLAIGDVYDRDAVIEWAKETGRWAS
jgi:hypothetical protein